MRRDVFQAIADPTRRQILGLLAKQPRHLNAIADEFEVSRPAISRHIRILKECGLVEIRREGRERHCKARLERLSEVNDWVEECRRFWNQKLDALGVYLESGPNKLKPTKKPRK